MKAQTAILFSVSMIISSALHAQKLTNVQQAGMRAPANIKIDGKVTEWDQNKLAYNGATEIFYELANDDNNLYLVIHAHKLEAIEKILLGSITFTIDSSGKKNDKGVAITFPTYYKNERPNINLKNIPQPGKDTLRHQAQVDSFRRVINKELITKSKLIEVEGVKGIPDSLSSIYNDQQIRAASLFDSQLNYNSELAIPIKYLNLNASGSFSYQIKLNGATANNARIQLSGSGRGYMVTSSSGSFVILAGSPYFSMVYATDFWGKYTLAKK